MSVRPGYAELIIDYTSLACFWSRLTDEQKKLINHEQFRYLPEDTEIKTESILTVWSKLTNTQKKLMKSDFFCDFKIEGRPTRSQRNTLCMLQYKHEEIINQKLVDKAKMAKKLRKKGPPGGSPPGPKTKWQTYKLIQKIGHLRCWYTGEECIISTSRSTWSATREHIIPQAYGWTGRRKNTAIAANFVNNLLGCAPIHVKMHVKRELSKISCLPTLNGKQKKKIYERIVKNILDQYKVFDSLPWNSPARCKSNKSDHNNAKLSIIRMAYHRHMILQKNYVDKIHKNCDNIRDYLEENSDGMETGLEQAHGLG